MNSKKEKKKIQYVVPLIKPFSHFDQDPSLDIKTLLDQNGFAIVPGVLTREEASGIRDEFWTWLEGFKTGIDRNNPKSWTTTTFPANIHGIFQHYAIGQTDFVWKVRQNPKVIKVFQDLFDEKNLLVSFDGANLSYPIKIHRQKPAQDWYHTDQGFPTDGFYCIQGLVNLNDNQRVEDGGLTVLKGSQAFHAEFFKRFPEHDQTKKDNFVRIFNQEEADFFIKEKGCEAVKICGKPGDLYLWDSRCFHQATRPTGPGCRSVVYVSYEPRQRATKERIEQKIRWFSSRRMTTHWAATIIKPFAKTPQTYGKKEKIENFLVDYTKLPILTDVGYKLAGFTGINDPRVQRLLSPPEELKQLKLVQEQPLQL